MDKQVLQIAVIDHHRVFVEALSFRLKSEPDLCVTAFAAEDADGEGTSLPASPPDVMVLDAELRMGRAFDLASEVRRNQPATKIVFLMAGITDVLVEQALRLKADGLVARSESLTQLVQAIRIVASGERFLSPEIASRVLIDPDRGTCRLRVEPALKGLTDRQLEILRHLARGDSVKAVARKLYLSPKSVDNQKFRIMTKLGVRDKVNLALFAVREGLIKP